VQRRVRNARRLLYGALARAATWVLMRLPFPWLRGFCRLVVGRVARRLHGRAAEERMITAFGSALAPTQRLALLDAMFKNLADVPAEALAAARRGAGFVRSRFPDGPGIAKLRAIQQGRAGGTITLSGHIGNWEMVSYYLRIAGARPLNVVAKRLPNPRLNQLVEELRAVFGTPTFYGDSGVTGLARVLARGETIGIVPDQDVEEIGGTFVDFLGRPAYTPIGPARLALATNSPIVVLFGKRVGDRFELLVNDPIEPDRRAPRDAEIVRITRAWSDQVEAFIKQHPEQWMWLHDRWQTTPEDVARRKVG
jgi:KDO2-lipid IV(A) lauroyltransferase